MKLSELLQVGSRSIEHTEREVSWEGRTFSVYVKSEMSAADFEFIYRSKDEDEDSYMARRVARSIVMEGGEAVPYEDAQKFKTSLLIALCGAIDAVQTPLKKETEKEPDEKKP